jgi:hypothetical protein
MKQQSFWSLDSTAAASGTMWKSLPEQSRAEIVAQLVRVLGQSLTVMRQQARREKQEEEP